MQSVFLFVDLFGRLETSLIFNHQNLNTMKRTALIILLTLPVYFCFASSSLSELKDPLASELMIPLFKTGKFISVENFIQLTPKDYKRIVGKKMSLKERIDLSFGKKYLKKAIKKDGTVDTRKMGFFGRWQWHWGGFFLGFFLSLPGVIITLFINDDYKWDRFWSAVKGALVAIAILSLILAISGVGTY